jgi:hypothetical protein
MIEMEQLAGMARLIEAMPGVDGEVDADYVRSAGGVFERALSQVDQVGMEVDAQAALHRTQQLARMITEVRDGDADAEMIRGTFGVMASSLEALVQADAGVKATPITRAMHHVI